MVDIYPTVKRSGKYLPCRLFSTLVHIGLFVPMESKKKRRNLEKKIKVNLHHIIAEDKKGTKYDLEREVSRHTNGWITEVITIVFSRHNRCVIHNVS